MKEVLNVAVPQVQKQSEKTDCGCFAIDWAVHLTYCDKPETVTETASFPPGGMSAQAAVYNVSTHYQKDMAKGQHIHKHFLLTYSFT